MKMQITFEGDVQQMLDILGMLIVEGNFEQYITHFESGQDLERG